MSRIRTIASLARYLGAKRPTEAAINARVRAMTACKAWAQLRASPMGAPEFIVGCFLPNMPPRDSVTWARVTLPADSDDIDTCIQSVDDDVMDPSRLDNGPKSMSGRRLT